MTIFLILLVVVGGVFQWFYDRRPKIGLDITEALKRSKKNVR